jgi:hypothetical protein
MGRDIRIPDRPLGDPNTAAAVRARASGLRSDRASTGGGQWSQRVKAVVWQNPREVD